VLIISLGIVLGLILLIGGWQLVVLIMDIIDKNKKYKAATAYARESGKPLLVTGGPWGAKRIRHWLNLPAHGGGDVCLDINHQAITGHPKGVIASVTNIPFSDKCFGAVFASHLLEHLPSTDEAVKALNEFDRIAETVFIVNPSRQSFSGWLMSDHHIWVWQKGSATYLKQRHKSGSAQVAKVIVKSMGKNE
jgi:hypothetical protein